MLQLVVALVKSPICNEYKQEVGKRKVAPSLKQIITIIKKNNRFKKWFPNDELLY
jgi:hypothetical protein